MSRLLRSTCVASLLLVGCGEAPPGLSEPIEQLPRQLTAAEEQIIQADNRFAFKVFREISRSESGNVFVSPLSVAMALGMTYNGAAGTTKTAMEETLELQGMTLDNVNQAYLSLIELLRGLDPGVEFVLANSIWTRESFPAEPAFIELNQTYFDAEVAALDFASPSASQTINGWVNDITSGRIPEIVPAVIPAEVVMYLINAIYFKGEWTTQFDKSGTRDGTFQLSDGSEVTVPMMSHGRPVDVQSQITPDAAIFELPYGGQAYAMTVVLPAALDGVDGLIDQLSVETWAEWTDSFGTGERVISLPRFKLEYELTMNDVLSALGMGIAFSDTEADFTGIYAGPERLYITEVKHKAFVDVNEEGTEAAAATSVGVGVTSAPIPFIVDRPFLFVLRERLSGAVMFMGKVMDPS